MLNTLRATKALPPRMAEATARLQHAADSVNSMAAEYRLQAKEHGPQLVDQLETTLRQVRHAALATENAAHKHRDVMDLVESVLWGVVLGLAAGMAIKAAHKLRGHLG